MRVTFILSGIPGYLNEDVKLSNIYIENLGGATPDAAQIKVPEKEDGYPEPGMFGQMPSMGFFLRHIRNVEMSHVELATLTPNARPAFYLQDVTRADFFAVTAPRPSPCGIVKRPHRTSLVPTEFFLCHPMALSAIAEPRE
jgi:hypothetical protein